MSLLIVCYLTALLPFSLLGLQLEVWEGAAGTLEG